MTGGRLAGPASVGKTTARQISHIIPHGHFSRPHENVAIPTIQIKKLKQRDGNYVQNCGLTARTRPHAATQHLHKQRTDAPSNPAHHTPPM